MTMTYSLFLENRDGSRVLILDNEPDPMRVRRTAIGISKRAKKRKVVITKNGKDLPGGANALDDLAYKMHWEALDEPEEQSSDVAS